MFLKFQFWLPDNVGFDKSHTFVLICPKNVYRSFLTHSRKLKKKFYLVEFSIHWLTHSPTYLLMPSNNHNSITMSTSLRSEMYLFVNCSSPSACIIVYPKLTFVPLCAPFLFPLTCRWQFAVHALWCKTWASAVLADVLFKCNSLLEMLPKVFDELEATLSVVMHLTHPHLYQ